MNGDLEVILLLTDKGLVSGGVDETFVCVYMVGRRGPGQGRTLLVHLVFGPTGSNRVFFGSLLTVSENCC